MSKLYYRLKFFLKQEKLINDYDISNLKLYINEKKLEHDYNLLRLKFENENKYQYVKYRNTDDYTR